ncbi:hypothetical protein A2714_02325 [Candidatus Woesebacteria bacterium RIFCSPHIGHO2_01_FULL_38_9]|uniref:Dipeptidylpeptidase IV N-terminal domain-containing protein n=1 Tax=Candidatus Woesebacteria bacterium RIFCSPHIGHO2_01_FULL_38_9 TaxID=1802492 RepID=A0A1F7Y2I4_9BACT|nr:MAG: hypothetical protein A2714_02325 [Candidatus Woesebacteria bacterium RIFCSPHIGHO2_01_FULL_38_9]
MEKRRNRYLITAFVFAALLTVSYAKFASFKVKNEVTPVTPHFSLEAKSDPGKETTIDFSSPDGTHTLTMKNGKEVGGVVTQTFFVSSEKDKTPINIFERDSDPDKLVAVPDNSFSPDHKYIFMIYEEDGKNRYIVFRTDGKDINKSGKTVEIESLFSEKFPDFVITDVTGWGSYSLIVVNSDTKEGKTGPSWWFDLSNFSFIRLSSRFN